MQGRDKEKPKSPAEELLEEAFDACMEEQMSFIPPESEIARMHTFSESFQRAMEQLLRTRGKTERRTISRKEFVYGFNRAAAGLLILFVLGGACAGGLMLLSRSSTKEMEAPAEAPASSETSDGYEDESAGEEAAPQESGGNGTAAGSVGDMDPGEGRPSVTAEFCGRTVELAELQKLSGEWEEIKTLVNSPVIARDAESFKVTIGNMEEFSIHYDPALRLEVCLEGAWYEVPARQELEERGESVTLESGMAQDEEIFLEDYDWDYEAERYRVVTRLEVPGTEAGPEEIFLSCEFRFENPEEDLEDALRSEEE